jgi:hypothetical protein
VCLCELERVRSVVVDSFRTRCRDLTQWVTSSTRAVPLNIQKHALGTCLLYVLLFYAAHGFTALWLVGFPPDVQVPAKLIPWA